MTMPADELTDRTKELALLLTSWPSVTGTAGEVDFSEKLIQSLARLPYFVRHSENLVRMPVEGDGCDRSNVLALVRGSGSRTILLAGHFDVVPVDDYGDLAGDAFSPATLREALLDRLRGSGRFARAEHDLASGRFLPGRGLLDMKSGLAAGIAVLEQFAAMPEPKGNLLLIATPDEEDSSAGMRTAAAALPKWLCDRGLEVALGINLDALCDNGDGQDAQVVAFGCIGKLLLSALVVGKEAHACYPLDGVNASYLAAELTAEFEFAPDLGERTANDVASPPTILGGRDLKKLYNVTTPGRAWLIWNVLIQRRSAEDVLYIAAELAERAVVRAKQRIVDRAISFMPKAQASEAWSRISVLGFPEVFQRACKENAGFASRFAARAGELAKAENVDLPTRSRMLTEFAWDAAGLEGPAVVLGFASMPYPAVNWPSDTAGERLRVAVMDAARRTSAERDATIGSCEHLPVIVDMSFLGISNPSDLKTVASATPLWGSSIRWNLDEPSACYPMVNIGPWGRDYHHWLERVDQHYAFNVLPYLIQNVVMGVLASAEA